MTDMYQVTNNRPLAKLLLAHVCARPALHREAAASLVAISLSPFGPKLHSSAARILPNWLESVDATTDPIALWFLPLRPKLRSDAGRMFPDGPGWAAPLSAFDRANGAAL
jgi:hypothetical protein